MNDRYLYRAKRTDNGEWIIGSLIQSPYLGSVRSWISSEQADKSRLRSISTYQADWRAFEVRTDTICQCTGLKDKNGKLIWENDKCMVRRPCVLAYGTIKYLDGCFCFVEDKTGNILRLCDVKTNGFEIKVESNIFDNPELLEPELLEVEHE